MAVGQSKIHIVFQKKKTCIEPQIEKYDIVKVVSEAFNESFCQKEHNLNSLADRGWNSLDYNLLDNPELCTTITKEDSKKEEELGSWRKFQVVHQLQHCQSFLFWTTIIVPLPPIL